MRTILSAGALFLGRWSLHLSLSSGIDPFDRSRLRDFKLLIWDEGFAPNRKECLSGDGWAHIEAALRGEPLGEGFKGSTFRVQRLTVRNLSEIDGQVEKSVE